jgi:hypothetical protein
MSIPPTRTPMQPPSSPHGDGGTTDPHDALALWPEPDTAPGPAPECCPTCGRAWSLFDHDTSQLLDCLALAIEAMSQAKSLVEEEDLP